jgi:hypothetical protein
MTVVLGIAGASGAAGWTQITPSGTAQNGYNGAAPALGTTMQIYVSNSTGKDPGDAGFVAATAGSSTTPYRTLAQGVSVLRDGQPDWILLKKGDTWTDEIFPRTTNRSGKSADEPMVYTSYGTGARPIIKSRTAAIGNSDGGHHLLDFSAYIGLDLWQYMRDPSTGLMTDASLGSEGVTYSNVNHTWILFEDCRFRNYLDGINDNFSPQPDYPPFVCQTGIYRRNHFVDCFGGSAFGSACHINFIMEENILDHNWTTSTLNGNPYVGHAFSMHNFYHAGYYFPSRQYPYNMPSNPANELVITDGGKTCFAHSIGNICLNDASGSHYRSGGIIVDNLHSKFWWAFDYGMPRGVPATLVSYNVAVEPYDNLDAAGGQGVSGFSTMGGYWYNGDWHDFSSLSIESNIASYINCPAGRSNSTGGIACLGQGSPSVTVFKGVVIKNNVVSWDNTSDPITESGVFFVDDEIMTGNYTRKLGSAWTLNNYTTIADPGFLDQNRCLSAYDLTLGGAGAGTVDNFALRVRGQSKDNWQSNLTAKAVNNWIRAGFNMPQLDYGTVLISPRPYSLSPYARLSPGMVGTAYSQSLSASGGTGPYTFTVICGKLPNPLTLSTGGLISGTPTEAGWFSFTVQAVDNVGVKGLESYSFAVVNNSAITFSPSSLPNGTVGTSYLQRLTTTGHAPKHCNFWVTSGSLPPGLYINENYGDVEGGIWGTPTANGSFPFVVTATDPVGTTAVQNYTIVIGVSTTPVISPNTVPNGTVGVSYGPINFSASGGTAPYTWTHSGTIPPGLTFNDVTAVLDGGAPTSAVGSPFAFRINATDSAGTPVTGYTDYTVTITAPAITISPSSLPPGTIGVGYNQTVTATGGTAPYTYAVSSGSLPPGLTLNTSSGAITGTPTGSPNIYPFAITATDSLINSSLPQSYNIQILAAPAQPKVSPMGAACM